MIQKRKWRFGTALLVMPIVFCVATVAWNPGSKRPEPDIIEICTKVSLRDGVLGANNAGQIVGTGSSRAMGCYLIENGWTADFRRVDPLNSGRDINNRGEILGTILESNREITAVWSPIDGVRVPDGFYPKCVALGINDQGVIVGFYPDHLGGLRAFRWSPSEGIVDLSDVTGCRFTRANGINNAGEIAGQIVSDGVEHAAVWRPGLGIIDVHPTFAEASAAYGLNDRGQVVGYCRKANSSFAFVWSQERGAIDLNQLLPPASDWNLSRATDINDNGEIVGLGRRSEKFRSFLLKL